MGELLSTKGILLSCHPAAGTWPGVPAGFPRGRWGARSSAGLQRWGASVLPPSSCEQSPGWFKRQ